MEEVGSTRCCVTYLASLTLCRLPCTKWKRQVALGAVSLTLHIMEEAVSTRYCVAHLYIMDEAGITYCCITHLHMMAEAGSARCCVTHPACNGRGR